MKKIIYTLLFSVLLFSCESEIKPGQMHFDNQYHQDYLDIRYFKDNKTNKCFAERGARNEYSFTCVECDSLVMLQINKNK